MKSKKELVESLESLKGNCYRLIRKDLLCRIFNQEMKTIYEALRKQDLSQWEERHKWYWEKYFLLLQVKFDVSVLQSEDPYYFLVKKTIAKTVKREDRGFLQTLAAA